MLTCYFGPSCFDQTLVVCCMQRGLEDNGGADKHVLPEVSFLDVDPVDIGKAILVQMQTTMDAAKGDGGSADMMLNYADIKLDNGEIEAQLFGGCAMPLCLCLVGAFMDLWLGAWTG